MKRFTLASIRWYQRYLSFIWGPSVCRFNPRCSEYTYQSIAQYGILKGVLMGIWRILHCHPFAESYG